MNSGIGSSIAERNTHNTGRRNTLTLNRIRRPVPDTRSTRHVVPASRRPSPRDTAAAAEWPACVWLVVHVSINPRTSDSAAGVDRMSCNVSAGSRNDRLPFPQVKTVSRSPGSRLLHPSGLPSHRLTFRIDCCSNDAEESAAWIERKISLLANQPLDSALSIARSLERIVRRATRWRQSLAHR